ncbi:hypothetical protein VNO78_25190 [Psophocarpus tetragonolobus]|uniref:Disease resistance protein At4g27190-like leucine-rich repeats domain-containing protein n=1 Tax=Psophocarpus tetragonolobus TaxID=3891 RepID=A0AAN9XFK3_PSOTE
MAWLSDDPRLMLQSLAVLEVQNCDHVKTLFDVKRVQDRTMTTVEPAQFPLPFRLKKFTLSKMPNLENVWNADPQRILRMQLLREVSVDSCKCLTNNNADPTGSNPGLTFPCVTSLTLCDLPKYGACCIHVATTTFELASNLQHLTLGENELKMILRGEFKANTLHKLKVLTLVFHMESTVFLHRVPSIEKLVVCDGSFKEISNFESSNVDEAGLLSQLKVLCLDSLPEIVSIGLENPWIVPFLRNLETLEVITADKLLGVKFQHSATTPLDIDLNFTMRKQKALRARPTIRYKDCRLGSEKSQMVFGNLNWLTVDGCQFSSNAATFQFLTKLETLECQNLVKDIVKREKLVAHNYEELIAIVVEDNANPGGGANQEVSVIGGIYTSRTTHTEDPVYTERYHCLITLSLLQDLDQCQQNQLYCLLLLFELN